jgi:hypothetical protein
MLQTFIDLGGAQYMPISDAQRFDQRPFRSMLIQEWIAYRPGRGFHLTRRGRDAWREFTSTEIFRKSQLAPLTRYFDPTVYGLNEHYDKIHVVPKRKVA